MPTRLTIMELTSTHVLAPTLPYVIWLQFQLGLELNHYSFADGSWSQEETHEKLWKPSFASFISWLVFFTSISISLSAVYPTFPVIFINLLPYPNYAIRHKWNQTPDWLSTLILRWKAPRTPSLPHWCGRNNTYCSRAGRYRWWLPSKFQPFHFAAV